MKIPSSTRGQTEVYKGPPCPSGHNGLRYKSTGQCVECKRLSGRKGAKSRGMLSDAVRKQSRWVQAFERNYATVAKLGIKRVLGPIYHAKPLQKWLYQMRVRWDDHTEDRRARLLALGQQGWWLRTDPPRHQLLTGFLVGSAEHKRHKREVNKRWRDKQGDALRKQYRTYYATNPEHREKAAAARRERFRQNPGLAAYLTSLRRKREKSQLCSCCANADFRRVYLEHAAKGLETDHKLSLAIATELGRKGMHCVSNLQGLTPAQHREKTRSDIDQLAEIRRRKKVAYHKTAKAARTRQR